MGCCYARDLNQAYTVPCRQCHSPLQEAPSNQRSAFTSPAYKLLFSYGVGQIEAGESDCLNAASCTSPRVNSAPCGGSMHSTSTYTLPATHHRRPSSGRGSKKFGFSSQESKVEYKIVYTLSFPFHKSSIQSSMQNRQYKIRQTK